MKLTDLSELILQLTDSAVEFGPNQHQNNLVDMLRSVVQFDSAWWGWSDLSGGRSTLVNTYHYNLPKSFDSAFGVVAKDDPFIRHGRNLPVFAMSLETDKTATSLDFNNFLNAFEIKSILNGHCRLKGETPFNFFMSLYRKGNTPFSNEERDNFRTILQHLEQCLSLSLRMELRALAPLGGEACLISENGNIVRATRRFNQNLFDLGFSQKQKQVLLIKMLAQGTHWNERGIIMKSQMYAKGLTIVRQFFASTKTKLSHEEAKVADLYVSGLTMRQISERKGVSVNTIRNQVASIYKKTKTSNKISLSQEVAQYRTKN